MRRVVVTGMGALTPVGNDVETFWNNIISGVCGIGIITKFDTSEYKVKIAAEVKDFDPSVYMEKSEIRKTDLFAQFAIAAAAQAVTDSGIIGSIEPERLGVYFGSGTGGLETASNEIEKLLSSGPKKVSPFYIPMMIANIASGHIAIRYNAQGPCIPIVTACATGTNSIGEAYRTIKHGYADAIITGGSEAAITPIGLAGFTNCLALTTTEDITAASIPFDRRRSGFVMGEGAGALILEEYEHAKNRGAKIYAEIAGYGSTCDAYHVTAPNPEAVSSAKAIENAYKESGMTDEKVIYINAHGTSTPLNDKTETLAIKKALKENAYSALVSSTKSMTAHMLGAAGAVEAIVCILALQNQIVPPTIGLLEADPECDLDYVPNKAREASISLALSSSLGFGGHNGCIAIKKI